MEHSHTFAGVEPASVYREFTSADFLRAFSAEVGVDGGELATSSSDGREVADMPWRFSTRKPGIPALAQKFLPEQVSLDWHQEWGPMIDSPIPGIIRVALHGKPSADVTATTALAGSGADTVYTTLSSTTTSLRWPVAGTVETSIDRELVGWILSVQARILRRRLKLAD